MMQKYSLVSKILFFCFLFGVLSFGRAFSILHINIGGFSLFITEAMLFISLPFIILNRRRVLKLPKVLLIALILFFVYGCFYLFVCILNRNLLGLRDVVLCGYILFLPLSFIILSQEGKPKLFLCIVILSNLLAIIVGRFLIFNIYPSSMLEIFIAKTKPFNLGFEYGLVISFLIPYYNFTKNRLLKIISLVFLSLNFYMLIILGLRTLWIAYGIISVFFLFILKKRFIRTLLNLMVPLVVITSILFCLDFKLINKGQRDEIIISKAKSLEFFVKITFLPRMPSSPKVANQPLSSKDLERAHIPSIITSPIVSSRKFQESLANINWRLEIWRQSIGFGLKSALFGRGFGIYPTYSIWNMPLLLPKKVGVDSGVIPAHNHLISIFYKMGFLGLSLFLIINFYIFVYGIKHIGKCRTDFTRFFLIGSLAAFVFWHSMALFFDMLDSPPTSIFLWIILGVILAIVEIDNLRVNQGGNFDKIRTKN